VRAFLARLLAAALSLNGASAYGRQLGEMATTVIGLCI